MGIQEERQRQWTGITDAKNAGAWNDMEERMDSFIVTVQGNDEAEKELTKFIDGLNLDAEKQMADVKERTKEYNPVDRASIREKCANEIAAWRLNELYNRLWRISIKHDLIPR